MGEAKESYPFYSNQCLECLTLALKKAELDTADDDFRRFYEAPVVDDSSSASSESETTSSDEDSLTGTGQCREMTANNDGKKEEQEKQEQSQTKSQTHNKEKETLIRQFGKPHTIELPLTNEDDLSYERIIEIPSALLSKEQRISDSRVICQAYYDLALDLTEHRKTIIVILLRSGRFAGAVFSGDKSLHHTTSSRYTIRKGQGKAQSSQDQKRRPKSVGSQLRRAGEEALRKDVTKALQEWKDCVNNAGLILLSCPKSMMKDFFDDNANLIPRNDARVRKIPLDFSRPTYQAILAIHQVLLTVYRFDRASVINSEEKAEENTVVLSKEDSMSTEQIRSSRSDDLTKEKKVDEESIPLTPLHKFAAEGNLLELVQIIKEIGDNAAYCNINQRAGPDFMTPLHYAAAVSTVDPTVAAACVTALLIEGNADPSVIDARHRPAYFLSCHDRVRDAFRQARASLGESHCDWDGVAKVGPPLTTEDLVAKKEKAAEKKRRQRARQKEKKAREREAAAKLEEQNQEAEKQKADEKDGTKDFKACDFCHQRLKRRAKTFERLSYKYCSTTCVQNHKRELMAHAALARFG